MKKIESSKYTFRTNYYADESGHIWSEYKKDFLTENDVREIISLIIEKKKTLKAIASQFGVSISTINRIKSKTSWTELTKDVIFD